MYNMLEDKKAEFEQSKEIIKEYLQALLDEYRYKQVLIINFDIY